MADWHRVGQRIVCIDDDFSSHWSRENISTPRVNSIYTIREIAVWLYGNGKKAVAFRLTEIIQDPQRWTGPGDLVQFAEIPFAAYRFRPLINHESDLALFEAILDRVNKREVVDA